MKCTEHTKTNECKITTLKSNKSCKSLTYYNDKILLSHSPCRPNSERSSLIFFVNIIWTHAPLACRMTEINKALQGCKTKLKSLSDGNDDMGM